MEFTKVITERETVRSFDGRKPSEEQLMKILEAGRIAPTAGNLQPQRVYVLESKEALRRMDRVHPNRYNASLVLLVCADLSVELYYKDMNLYQVDGSIAATHMLLAAYDAGVDSAWLGIYDVEQVQEVFDLPEYIVPVCFIDLGFRSKFYMGNPSHKDKYPMENMVTRI